MNTRAPRRGRRLELSNENGVRPLETMETTRDDWNKRRGLTTEDNDEIRLRTTTDDESTMRNDKTRFDLDDERRCWNAFCELSSKRWGELICFLLTKRYSFYTLPEPKRDLDHESQSKKKKTNKTQT
jgi:hypothetical protein